MSGCDDFASLFRVFFISFSFFKYIKNTNIYGEVFVKLLPQILVYCLENVCNRPLLGSCIFTIFVVITFLVFEEKNIDRYIDCLIVCNIIAPWVLV